MRGFCLVILAAAISACGNASTSVDFSSPITACRSFALAVCTVEASCQYVADINSCTQLLENENGCNQAGCGTGVYSPTAAQTCYNAYNSQTCAESNSSTIPGSCQQTLICPGA